MLEQQRKGSTYQLVYGRDNPQGVAVVEQVKISTGVTAFVESDPETGQPSLVRSSTETVSP